MNAATFSLLPRALEHTPIVIVPGLRNSDDNHWQSLWHQRLPASKRIQLQDWDTPNLEAWRAAIKTELFNSDTPAVLVAHSFGALASAAIAAEFPERVAAVFLVAPADPEKFGIADQLPQHFLPVSAKVIASSNDPWMTEAKAAYWALVWGADYSRFKNLGHINSLSNLGIWSDGLIHLQRLVLKEQVQQKLHQVETAKAVNTQSWDSSAIHLSS